MKTGHEALAGVDRDARARPKEKEKEKGKEYKRRWMAKKNRL